MTDTTDSEILAERFDLGQLRHELHNAEVNCLPDQDDYGYWLWYRDIVKDSISIKKETQPKPVIRPGHIDVEAIRQRADLIAIIENYGIKIKKAGNSWRGMCPFHEGKSPALAVYPDEQTWYCYACNIGGDVFEFVKRIENCDFKTAAIKVGETR